MACPRNQLIRRGTIIEAKTDVQARLRWNGEGWQDGEPGLDAIDRYGHRGTRRAAVPVADGVGEIVGRGITRSQGCEYAVRVVIVAAVGVEREQRVRGERDL